MLGQVVVFVKPDWRASGFFVGLPQSCEVNANWYLETNHDRFLQYCSAAPIIHDVLHIPFGGM
jgi:hypothetical protein